MSTQHHSGVHYRVGVFSLVFVTASMFVVLSRGVLARNCVSNPISGLSVLASQSGTLWAVSDGVKHPILSLTEAVKLGKSCRCI